MISSFGLRGSSDNIYLGTNYRIMLIFWLKCFCFQHFYISKNISYGRKQLKSKSLNSGLPLLRNLLEDRSKETKERFLAKSKNRFNLKWFFLCRDLIAFHILSFYLFDQKDQKKLINLISTNFLRTEIHFKLSYLFPSDKNVFKYVLIHFNRMRLLNPDNFTFLFKK